MTDNINIIKLLLLLPFAVVLSSCEKEISLDVEEFEPSIVVNALFEANTPWSVDIHRTRNALKEAYSPPITHAQVHIKELESGSEIKLHHLSNGNYASHVMQPKPGHAYMITVEADGYNKVTSVGYVPEEISVNLLVSEKLVYEGKEALRIDFEILDDGVNDNYYIYEIQNKYSNSQYNDGGFDKFLISPIKTWLSSLDGNTGYIVNGTNKQSKLFITNDNFSGSILNTSLVSYLEVDEKVNKQEVPAQEIEQQLEESHLKVVSASYDMYEYYKFVELNIQKKTVNSSITTPITPYTNIQGGYGIFAGYTSTSINLL